MANPSPESPFAPMLQSQRLSYTLVRANSKSDMHFIAHCLNTLFSPGPTDGSWADADIRRLLYGTMLKSTDLSGRISGDPAVYIVCLSSTPETRIGFINLCRRCPDVPLDFGYGLLPEYHQQGYGTEAATRILQYWTSEFGIQEICVVTGDTNIASLKLARKVGFIEGGWAQSGGQKHACLVLPGMKELVGQEFNFWGDGKEPSEA